VTQVSTNEALHKELREVVSKFGAFKNKYSESIAQQMGPVIDNELNEIWIEIGKIMQKFGIMP